MANAGITTRSTIARAYDRVLKRAVRNGIRTQTKPIWREMVKIESSTNQSERFADYEPLGFLREKPEGASPSTDAPVQGYSIEIVPLTYALAVQVTMEAMQDARMREMINMTTQLGQSVQHFLNAQVADLVVNGFTTTYYATGDTLAIFSDSHTHPNGRTYDNLISAQVVSPSAVQSAIFQIRHRKNGRGQPLNFGMGTYNFFYAESQEARVFETLQSMKVPYSGDNTENWVARQKINPIMNPYFTGNEWMLQDVANHEMIFVNRMNYKVSRDGDYMTDNALFKVVGRSGVGVLNGLAISGSQGA